LVTNSQSVQGVDEWYGGKAYSFLFNTRKAGKKGPKEGKNAKSNARGGTESTEKRNLAREERVKQ